MDVLLENSCIGQTIDEIYVSALSAGSPVNTIDAMWLL